MKKKYSAPYQYEEHIAEILPRARRTMASGALHGDMDVQSAATEHSPGYVVDCKLTDAKSFRVTSKEFSAVEDECEIGQIPVMFVKLGDGNSYAVIKEEDMEGFAWSVENEGKNRS